MKRLALPPLLAITGLVLAGCTNSHSSLPRGEMGQPLLGHTDQINSVAFSPDGRVVASAGNDVTILLWGFASRKPLGRPLQVAGEVHGIAFSANGRLVAGASDQGVRLWDAKTHRQLGSWLAHVSFPQDCFYSVAFSPDGKSLAAGDCVGTIWLWDVRKRKLLWTATNTNSSDCCFQHINNIESLAFSPDGRMLAASSDNKTVRLWDTRTHRPVGPPLRGHTDEVWSVAFSPNGRVLASGSADGTIRLWDVRRPHRIGIPLRGHTGPIHSLAFSPDGRLLASGTYNSTIVLWDVRTHRLVGTPLRDPSPVRSVAFNPSGTVLASGDSGQGNTPKAPPAVRFWDIAKIVQTKH
jgi:WD40 repeat protein